MLNITSIKQILNTSRHPVTLQNLENPGNNVSLSPLEVRSGLDIWIPWCEDGAVFPSKHLLLTVGSRQFAVWQSNQTRRIHLSVGPWPSYPSQVWEASGNEIFGVAIAEGDRTMVASAWGPLLEPRTAIWDILPQMAADNLRNFGKSLLPNQYRMSSTTRAVQPIRSTPKLTSTAFSTAGRPSDALDCGQGSARYLYRDSGKRYEFSIRSGVVYAREPDGTETALTRAVSYDVKRSGEYTTAPPFDLIASSGGRVFAKQRDEDNFYFAMLDSMFIHVKAMQREFAVPSVFFKLDPEWNQPNANTADLTAHLIGDFEWHPCAERFLIFRLIQETTLWEAMIVRKRRYFWHKIDARPLLNCNPLAALNSRTTPGWDLAALFEPVDTPVPPNIAAYINVRYSAATGTAPEQERQSVDFERVLDIGVGHVHHHDQYERVTGGELQPIRSSLLPIPGGDYAFVYRLFNGPVRDADGFIDGTCNYYLLVKLRDGPYRILFLDEQIFFTQRWRIVGPDDNVGMAFALTADLAGDNRLPLGLSRYKWVRGNYWCPFEDGYIGPQSRMAVAAQVILVTAHDPVINAPVIYSINFSYSTMDRTWRWRRLPALARYFSQSQVDAGDESIALEEADTVYPQTIRLREDMTLHLKGTRRRAGGGMDVGHWYQRYLPATNRPAPSLKTTPGRPAQGYEHKWKFLPEAVFARAGRFSHFGVYDSVNSRTQYYVVQPRPGDEATLEAGSNEPWLDENRRLYTLTWKFPWDGRLRAREPWRPPSMFNTETRLLVVRRGSLGWIAMHWDKRDDDLMPFDGLPAEVVLTQAGVIGVVTATVTVQSNIWVEEPPVVELVQLTAASDGDVAEIRFVTPQQQRQLSEEQAARLAQNPRRFILENVWRVRMARFSGDQVVTLLDLTTEAFTAVNDFEYRLTLTPEQQQALRGCCTVVQAAQHGTTIWFEDIVGHAAPPQEVKWLPALVVSVQPSPIYATGTVQITVSAKDDLTGQNVAGTVEIAGNPTHPTNTPFSIYLTDSTPPQGRVRANGYATVPIPWPRLIVSTYSAGFADTGTGIGDALL